MVLSWGYETRTRNLDGISILRSPLRQPPVLFKNHIANIQTIFELSKHLHGKFKIFFSRSHWVRTNFFNTIDRIRKEVFWDILSTLSPNDLCCCLT